MIYAIRNRAGLYLKKMAPYERDGSLVVGKSKGPKWVAGVEHATHYFSEAAGRGVVTRITREFPGEGVISLVPLELAAGTPIIEIDPDRYCCDCGESYRCDLRDKNDCPVFCPKCRK